MSDKEEVPAPEVEETEEKSSETPADETADANIDPEYIAKMSQQVLDLQEAAARIEQMVKESQTAKAHRVFLAEPSFILKF